MMRFQQVEFQAQPVARLVWALGLSLLIVGATRNGAMAAESTVRFVEMQEGFQTKPTKTATAKEGESLQVKAAAPRAPEAAKKAVRPPAELSTDRGEFAKAIREAVALREATKQPVRETQPVEKTIAVSTPPSSPTPSRAPTPDLSPAPARTPETARTPTPIRIVTPARTPTPNRISAPAPTFVAAPATTPATPAVSRFADPPSRLVASVPRSPVVAEEHPEHIIVEDADGNIISPSRVPVGPPVCGPTSCPYCPGQSGAPYVCGVDCGPCYAPCDATWHDSRCIPWSLFGPGEYVGPPRTEHVGTYYLRVNDLLTLTYIASRRRNAETYQIGVGDRLRVESSVDESLDREVEVQPDGEITLPIVGQVMAAGKTVRELREDLDEVFLQAQRQPQITVTPLEINAALREILRSVKAEIGSQGQAIDLRVTPEGTIQVPGLGSVYVQGLTLDELSAELEARYSAMYGAGLIITPALTERAPSFVFVGGEVKLPGRYALEGPTTVMQAIALAGGWNIGGDLHHVVVFRRDENWCLKATRIDIRAPLYGNDPCPVNDIWLRDNDLVIVPKSRILCATDVINLYFTRGVYAVFPVTYFYDLSSGSTVIP